MKFLVFWGLACKGVYYSLAVRRIRPYLDAEYGFCKKISAVCGSSVATRLRKMEFKRTVSGFALTSWWKAVGSVPETLPFTLLSLDKRHYLSRLRIAVKTTVIEISRFT